MECDDAAPLATSEANEGASEAATNEEPASQQQLPAAPDDSSRTTGGRYVMLALSVAVIIVLAHSHLNTPHPLSPSFPHRLHVTVMKRDQ